MENLKNQIRHKKNELMRVKNECRQKEDNLRYQIDTEYKNILERNEYLKNKEYEERKRIKENYEKQEREIKKNNIVTSKLYFSFCFLSSFFSSSNSV